MQSCKNVGNSGTSAPHLQIPAHPVMPNFVSQCLYINVIGDRPISSIARRFAEKLRYDLFKATLKSSVILLSGHTNSFLNFALVAK
jgi:hypothetical protein